MNQNRRHLFRLGALAGLLLVTAGTRRAQAATIAKASAVYQDVPSAQGKVCAQCIYFIPLQPGASLATCKLIAGGIAPGGWCDLWAPKAS